jgi:hypothetical protein
MSDKSLTLGRLEAALKRLESGTPNRVKPNGNISLNKINNEAGLGHSYIHKFTDFVRDEANPRIKAYNEKLSVLISNGHVIENDGIELSEVDKLKTELKREISLKDKYRKERNDALECKKEVEQLNTSLMFRLYELQNEIRINSVVRLSSRKS